jgi:hypothetical protein
MPKIPVSPADFYQLAKDKEESKPMQIELLNAEGAAFEVGVAPTTINRWHRLGMLEGIPIGRGFLYTKSQVWEAQKLLGEDRKEKEVTYVNKPVQE